MEPILDLSKLSEAEFERERCRLIERHLNSLPPDVSKRMRLFQMKLDMIRDQLESSEEFMAHCFSEAGKLLEKQGKLQLDLVENINDVAERFLVIDATTGGAPPPLPDYAAERSALS